MPINQTSNVTSALVEAYGIATEKRNEYLTPEHLLAGYLKDKDFWDALSRCGRSEELEADIYRYINDLEHVPADRELSIEFSAQLQELFERAAETASSAMVQTIQTHHLIYSIFHLEDSYARFHLESCLDCSIPDFLNSLIGLAEEDSEAGSMQPEDKWSRYFRPVEPDGNIVGRKEETAKILRILCRRNKNNALLVGGRGVGKTAIARGIAALLAEENVPEKLKGYELMELNTGMLLSGTQYRGDLEGRVQSVMDSIAVEQGIIVYVDELRSLGGMSRMEDGTKDILSLLNPYFRSGNIKFIISATPEDIKKLNSVDGGIAGLFRIVEIEEPSEEEAGRIIEGILPSLSEYHGVSYDDEVVSHSISLSKRYIMDRCLPDKAIDLLDEVV